MTTFRASKPDDFYQLLHEAVGAGGGEGPDGGGAGRKSFAGGAKIAALVWIGILLSTTATRNPF